MRDTATRAAKARRAYLAGWLPSVAWATGIFLLSAQPSLQFVPDQGSDFVIRKLGHMAVFGVLALLVWFALAKTPSLRWPWAWALALTVLYAVTDEIHQGLVAGRDAWIVDVAIDGAGALLAVTVVGTLRSRRWSAGFH